MTLLLELMCQVVVQNYSLNLPSSLVSQSHGINGRGYTVVEEALVVNVEVLGRVLAMVSQNFKNLATGSKVPLWKENKPLYIYIYIYILSDSEIISFFRLKRLSKE